MADHNVQVFVVVRDFGETLELSGLKWRERRAEDRAAFSSESNGDSTANRTSVRTNLQDSLGFCCPGLDIQQIAGVDDCLGPNR